MKQKKKRLVIQPHHIRYKDDPKGEWVVSMYKGEHFIIGRMNWRKNVSLGFIEALQDWLQKNVEKAVAL